MLFICVLDEDGLIKSKINPYLLSNGYTISGRTANNPGDPPAGHAWQHSLENGWKLVPDLRGKSWVNPEDETDVFTVRKLLETPPEGWTPIN